MGAPTGGVATVSDQLLALADIARGWDAVVEGVHAAGHNLVDLGEISAEGKQGVQTLDLNPGSAGAITFTITEPMMVNLWVDMDIATVQTINRAYGLAMPSLYDLSLELRGANLPSAYTSQKTDAQERSIPFAGESVSTVLPAGTYVLTVRDHSAYESGLTVETFPAPIPVHLNIQRYTTQKIEGQISIGESRETMPVSMSVAEFYENGDRKLNYGEENGPKALDPSKPVWVVVPGRGDNEMSDPMKELAQSISLHNVQVVTIDWSDAAKDNFPGQIGLQGSNWIEAVGKWTANQLRAAGFPGEQINIVGHSWGSYVGYEIAEHVGGDGVNTVVALDPAKDTIFSGYNESQVDFSRYSTKSFALHSSFYGDEARALTADYAIQVVDDNISRPSVEHGYAVTAFSSLLQSAQNPYDPVASWFTPQQLMHAGGAIQSHEGWDGLLRIATWESQREDGTTWRKALPQLLEYTDANTGEHVVGHIIGNHTIS